MRGSHDFQCCVPNSRKFLIDLPNQPINIRWVLHLAGVCPIVIKLQLPEEDGGVISLWVPIPDHPVLEPPTHGPEGIDQEVPRPGHASLKVRTLKGGK